MVNFILHISRALLAQAAENASGANTVAEKSKYQATTSGVLALAHVTAPVLRLFIHENLIRNEEYHIHMQRCKAKDMVFELSFDHFDIIALTLACSLGFWYLLKKHWIANNLFGLAFAHNGIELLQLNSVATGCILLGGLFIYDVFWVFGTDVMVTVAKSFEAPIKLLFPQDFLEAGVWGSHHAMLGLGDIVIPGIFIALLLRYDMSKGSGSKKIYFAVSFVSYVVGLIFTVSIMTIFKHAQPALLYLVPLCVGVPLFTALILGEIKELFLYRDNPHENTFVAGQLQDQKAAVKEPTELTKTTATSGEKNGVATRSKAKKDI
ncbi:minor histocompatibility antigen H13-like [Tropilaelaps mercedesae]|uniref:Minor histocompatibility antigen H13-like n=1 Tax=Tropilaelaps mercedesae TaxID=418985 RepID=A0A1V9XSV2_9ACAR|nr:minor histocompatibility antigen H13-like [Tropilaelaps mercedesae]